MICVLINSRAMTDMLTAQIAEISRLIRRSFDGRVRVIGVTRPQWQVLSALKRREGISQAALADAIDSEPITVCRIVDRLEEAGLVERRADPSDHRSWRLFLTDRAREVIAELLPHAEALHEEAFAGFDEAERKTLALMLDRVRANLAGDNGRSRPELTGISANG